MAGPTNGTVEEILASAMTNQALAQRLSVIRWSRRSFSKAQTDALLEEAAKRLRWPDTHAAHQEET
jgi:hypothetical protein